MTEQQAQEPVQTEPTEPQGSQTEPQGSDGTDWKAEARKWEARAKANTEKAKRLDEIEEANKSELQKAHEAEAAAQKEAAEAKAQLERMSLISRVSKETGIPQELLHGDTEEELKGSAEALKSYMDAQRPSIPADQGGSAGAPTVTKETIAAIKDPVERVRAMAANSNLYTN